MTFYLVISCSSDLVIILHNSYSSRTSHVHYIYMSHHACMIFLYIIYHPDYSCYCNYFQFSILSNILFLCPTYCYYFFIFSLLSFFPFVYSCWSASDGPLLYFSVFRSGSRYRELIIEHILLQLFSGKFSFFLTCLIQIWWMKLFMFQYFIYVLLSLRLVVYAYMCATLLVIGSLRYSWKRFLFS